MSQGTLSVAGRAGERRPVLAGPANTDARIWQNGPPRSCSTGSKEKGPKPSRVTGLVRFTRMGAGWRGSTSGRRQGWGWG